MRIFILYHE